MGAKEIVEQIIEYKGLSVPIFASRLGVTAQNIYDILRGKTPKLSSRLRSIIMREMPDINPDWLLTGEGEMLTSHVEQTNVNGDNNNFSTVNKADDKLLAELANAHKLTENAQEQVNRLISIIEKMQNNH